MMGLVDARFYWAGVLTELRRVLIQTETNVKEKLNTDVGLWVETFSPQMPAGLQVSAGAGGTGVPGGSPGGDMRADPAFQARYGMRVPTAPSPVQAATAAAPSAENEINTITMVCRGINLEKISPTADKDLAYALEEEIKKSPLFTDGTALGDITVDPTSPLTFTFNLTLKLKRPFKL